MKMMQRLFERQISKMVASERFASEKELYVHVMLLITAATASIMHVLLLFSALSIKVYPMVFINIGSVVSYFVMFSIVRYWRANFAAGVLVAVEVIIFVLLATYFIGINTFVIMLFFILVLMEWNVPYTSTRNMGIITVFIWLAAMAALVIGVYVPPVYPIQSQTQILTLSVFHISLTCIGIAIVLFIVKLVQKTIADSTAAQIAQYREQATIDALTALSNRRGADLFIAELKAGEFSRPWCVAMVDIDDFKKVNDSLGHLVGDEVLRAVSQTLTRTLRRTDMIFRWGGEEFMLFLADVKEDIAVGLLEKICKTIEETPIKTGDASISNTVTIGVAQVDVKDIHAAIDLCDRRMYYGKRNGKNQVVSYLCPEEV